MRFAYLTTAYHELVQLERLQRSLAIGDPDALRVVQFDISSPHAARAREVDATVRYTRRGINWGDGTYLDALLDSLASLRDSAWDWLVLLSGQDHPVRPLDELRRAIEHGGAVAYSSLRASAAGVDDGDPEPITRYFYRYHSPQRIWPPAMRKASLLTARQVEPLIGHRVRLQPRPRRLAPAIGLRTRGGPFSAARPCHQGSEYIAMSRVAVNALLELVDSDPTLVRYLRRTFIPTEAFFASGLRWIFGDDVADLGLHYMRFGGHANPKLLTAADEAEITGSGRYFARKFTDESGWVEEAFAQ